MNTDTMRIIAYVLYAAGAVLLIAAAFFFWKLRIPEVINDLNGKTARRDIAQRRDDREKKKVKGKKASTANQVYHGSYSSEGTNADGDSSVTVALRNFAGDSEETRPLTNTDANETTPLGAGMEDEETRPLGAQPHANRSAYAPGMAFDDDTETETMPLGSAPARPAPAMAAPMQARSMYFDDEENEETQPLGMENEDETLFGTATGSVLAPHNRNISAPELQTAPLNQQPMADENDLTRPLRYEGARTRTAHQLEMIDQQVIVHTDEVIPIDSY